MRDRDDNGTYTQEITRSDVVAAMKSIDGTDLTPREIADVCECHPKTVTRRLHDLEETGRVKHRETSTTTLWWLV